MKYLIKELRNMTGMSQTNFAQTFDIPVSTLRKWEQGETTPAPYIVNLIARAIPETRQHSKKIRTENRSVYYYDKLKKTVSDAKGNEIYVEEDLEGVKEENLGLYLTELFSDFYEIQARFNRDCRFDKEEDIIWS